VPVLRMMTLAFWQADNLAAAARAVRDWARVDGERPAAHRFAARIYEDMGAIDLAAEAAERAVARAPGDAGEWARLGRLRLRLRDRDRAIEALRRAQSLEPSVEALLDLALALQLAGDTGGEVSACEQAVELDGESLPAWVRLAHALARTDRISECLSACERALELGGGSEVRELFARMRKLEPRVLPAA
jgi:tetratricopeptide (TPR) repeat protein